MYEDDSIEVPDEILIEKETVIESFIYNIISQDNDSKIIRIHPETGETVGWKSRGSRGRVTRNVTDTEDRDDIYRIKIRPREFVEGYTDLEFPTVDSTASFHQRRKDAEGLVSQIEERLKSEIDVFADDAGQGISMRPVVYQDPSE